MYKPGPTGAPKYTTLAAYYGTFGHKLLQDILLQYFGQAAVIYPVAFPKNGYLHSTVDTFPATLALHARPFSVNAEAWRKKMFWSLG